MLGPLMIDIEGTNLSSEEHSLLQHRLVGGVILFARNYENPEQLSSLTDTIRSIRNPRLLIAVDQEGGRIQRFRSSFSALPAPGSIGDLYDQDKKAAMALAEDCGWLMASELRAVGVDFSFAPVLDLRTSESTVIGERAFHRNSNIVSRLAQSYVAGMRDAGVSAVGKHFPGHGSVVKDSHRELPIDERDFYDISRTDLLPFRTLINAGIAGVMTAHVQYPKVDNCVATYSKIWIKKILRQDMHFEGVVFSDDLSMAGAMTEGDHLNRVHKALACGCDMLLICNDRQIVKDVLVKLEDNVNPLAGARLMRMHSRGKKVDREILRNSSRWLHVSNRIAGGNHCPELDLNDRNTLR